MSISTQHFCARPSLSSQNEPRSATSYLGLHLGPALLLLLAPPHVLVLLLRLAEGLQELVEDAEELVRLHLAGVLAKVLDCPQELRGGGGGGGSRHSSVNTLSPSPAASFTGASLAGGSQRRSV